MKKYLNASVFIIAIACIRSVLQRELWFDEALTLLNFVLPLDPEGNASAEEIEARKKLTQYSVVWSPSGQENKVVISGLGGKDTAGFKVYGGGAMSPAQLQKHTVGAAVKKDK